MELVPLAGKKSSCSAVSIHEAGKSTMCLLRDDFPLGFIRAWLDARSINGNAKVPTPKQA